eukprot:gnl/MRDRNA2_/MRDRNA2_90661_c0_seq1.p1 gnl/MRDRNA2_/MRDRNA2_90661_c0~~gnl/MRDRNA2_/MRDRNA2_90661_c0_seq1.p1  ORF type:complete len:659 (-),score=147.35 gnl/MRDRNA2_/MRDRNA2_90661_c0_seq1:22-1998(-)
MPGAKIILVLASSSLLQNAVCEYSSQFAKCGVSLLQSGTKLNKLQDALSESQETMRTTHVKQPLTSIATLLQDGKTYASASNTLSAALLRQDPAVEETVVNEVQQFLKSHVVTAVREEVGGSLADAVKNVVRDKVGTQGSLKQMVHEAVKENIAKPTSQVLGEKVQFLLRAKVHEALKEIVAEQVRDDASKVLEDVSKTMVGQVLGDELKNGVSARVKYIMHSRSEIDDGLQSQMEDRLGRDLEKTVKEEVSKKMGAILKESIQSQLYDVMHNTLADAVQEEVADNLDQQEVLDELKEQALAGAGMPDPAKQKQKTTPVGAAEASTKKAVEAEATPPMEKSEEKVDAEVTEKAEDQSGNKANNGPFINGFENEVKAEVDETNTLIQADRDKKGFIQSTSFNAEHAPTPAAPMGNDDKSKWKFGAEDHNQNRFIDRQSAAAPRAPSSAVLNRNDDKVKWKETADHDENGFIDDRSFNAPLHASLAASESNDEKGKGNVNVKIERMSKGWTEFRGAQSFSDSFPVASALSVDNGKQTQMKVATNNGGKTGFTPYRQPLGADFGREDARDEVETLHQRKTGFVVNQPVRTSLAASSTTSGRNYENTKSNIKTMDQNNGSGFIDNHVNVDQEYSKLQAAVADAETAGASVSASDDRGKSSLS